ncbi:P-loop NTPase fold protein [Brevundimonas sp. 2R-24]|uniref:P-loop NTPase fold protein n=1 Tax=Peiella sedimenti TaxID=3061083 RepID=A0ABT8SH90_9CAUL|nr:P-loop NTPase fold protein [Caulobacteraceae bacterium XZ-24]
MMIFGRRLFARGDATPAASLLASSLSETARGVTVQADRPINRIADDRFDRAPFAVQIAKVIAGRQDPSSLVVGLYGPWGDGKTSVLSMTREALAAYPDVISMEYNPWFYGSSTEAITRSFFKSLSETLEKSRLLSRDNIGQLMSTLGRSVPHAGEAVAAVGELLGSETLTDTRDRVSEILRRHKKKIVVFIDDIDRLDRADIQTLFKLVRLSGGFDHTTYVLAFDEEVVAEALGEAYGTGGAVAGRRFLEKIVQVPLHLPPASPEKLRQHVFAACDRVISENGLELAAGQNIELGNGLVEGIGAALKTPRQVKLFDNAITFAVPILKNEVHTVDLILIEALRTFYPSVYKAVRHHPDDVLSRRAERQLQNQPEVLSPLDVAIDALDVPSREKDAVRRLIEGRFPRRRSIGYGDTWDQVWASEKRVCARDYFDRYFVYAVPTGDISDHSIEQLILNAIEGNDEAVAAIIDSAFERQASDLLVRKLRHREETMDTNAARPLSLALASEVSRVPKTADIFLGDYSLIQVAVLISRLVERLAPAQQDALLAEVAERTDSLFFLQELIRTSRMRTSDDGEQRGFLEPERVHPLAAILFRRLKEMAADSNPFDATEDRLARVAYCIETSASAETIDDLKRYLREVLEADTGNALRLLKAFTGRSQGASGEIGYSDFSRNSYDGLITLIDPDLIYAKLRDIYGDELDSATWGRDWSGTQDTDRRLANQFSAIRRAPPSAANGAEE